MIPLVSILIPSYNSERWIRSTIESAIGQTWLRKEIIIVDDGSIDQTLPIARKYASSNVQVISQENQGAAAARNIAFASCQGDLIQWLDADDLLSLDKIERQVHDYLKEGDSRVLMSSGWGRFMHRPESAKFTPSALWNDLSVKDWLIYKLEQNLFMQTATWLVSRELSEKAGAWDTRMKVDDDGEYFCRVLMNSCGVRFVPEGKVYYRESGPDTLSYIGRSDCKLEAHLLTLKLHVERLLLLDAGERARRACSLYLQRNSEYFYPERMDLFQEVCRLAESFGESIEVPRLSWKYHWICSLFGWESAKWVQRNYNNAKQRALVSFDGLMNRYAKNGWMIRKEGTEKGIVSKG